MAGVQTNDLLRLGVFTLFAADEGRVPDRQWYIVNQFRQQEPDQRNPSRQLPKT